VEIFLAKPNGLTLKMHSEGSVALPQLCLLFLLTKVKGVYISMYSINIPLEF
jgi:hypothetical protein